MENKKQYIAPELTVVTFKAERGFALSGPTGYKETGLLDMFLLDPSLLICSIGNLTGVVFSNNIDVTSVPDTVSVQITDGNTTAAGAKASDEVRVFVYCPDADAGVLSVAAARAAGKIEVPVPEDWSGLDVHVYGFTVGESKNSPTDYIGHATLN